MTDKKIAEGVAHKIPADLQEALIAVPVARAVWEDLTPLARNEWICWVISGKKAQTRDVRIKKGLSKLKSGIVERESRAGAPVTVTRHNSSPICFTRRAYSSIETK